MTVLNGTAARMATVADTAGAAVRRRRFADTAARWVVRAGGLATIVSIVAIVGFITLEVAPLWRAPRAVTVPAFTLSEPLLAPVVDEHRELLAGVSPAGVVRVLRVADGGLVEEKPVAALAGQPVRTAARAGRDHVLLGTADGRLVGIRIASDVRRQAGQRVIKPRVVETGSWVLSPEGAASRLLASSVPDEQGVTAVFAPESGPPVMVAVTETRTLFGAGPRTETRHPLVADGGTPSALAINDDGSTAYVGWSTGLVQVWDLRERTEPRLWDTVDVTGDRAIPVTAAAFLLGGRSIVLGDGAGKVSVWFPVRDATGAHGWRLQRVHELGAHGAAVTAVAVSPRDRGFLTADSTGRIQLHHATTAQTLLELPDAPAAPVALIFAPKANGALAVGRDGRVGHWDLANPHPDVTIRTLFSPVWYEGYEEPAYVWQSTGGTDEFEAKFSLVPLVLGTMKGTLYALLFAVPIAVLAAIYTSQFCHPSVRGTIKPTVEIMAALPSVVLGFLAGLWLAPAIEAHGPGVLVMLAVLPLLVFAGGVAWHALPARWRGWVRPGGELLVLAPLMLMGAWWCLHASPAIEAAWFGGNFRAWLSDVLGLRFDQRNSLVVGFAMGFAVIPIIFTISEDALSNVPQRLVSASLALGATRWQTALRVVLPTASPGIFSAIMVGFGRAVGETMIVLMATGNTPVLDWNIFTGMRTLSANIAVEIPEAPYGSTLYRVLFLAALLLFVATFLVNTAAELVRLRLRKRYQQL